MIFSPLARQYGGVAYREEDRGDGGSAGGGGKEDEAALAAAAADKAASEKAVADKLAAEKADREKGVTIPKSRFDEAVGKERARAEKAEKALAETQATRQAAADVKKVEEKLDELETSLEKAMAEGTPEQRKELRKQIREQERLLGRAEAKQEAGIAQATAIEQYRYDAVVERAEEAYPFLVPDGEQFNESITKDLLELKLGYEGTGLSSSEALKKAMRLLKPQLDAAKAALASGDKGAKEKAEKDAKEKAEKEKADKDGAEAKTKAEKEAADRRAEAVARGLDAAGRQGAKPNSGVADKEAKELDVAKISDAQFDKLSDEEKKKLRGD